MFYKLSLLLLSLILTIFAQDGISISNVTISGMVIDNVTGAPIPNAKIEFARIGDDLIKDTISSKSNGYYEFVYPFELIEYKKKYTWIQITLLSDTYWHQRQIAFTITDLKNLNIDCIPKKFNKISGYVRDAYSITVPNIPLKLVQISSNFSDTLIDTLVTDSQGYYETQTDNGKYFYFLLGIISKDWDVVDITQKQPYFWQNNDFSDPHFTVIPVDTTKIAITGKVSISNFNHFALITTSNEDSTFSNQFTGDFKFYVPRGWSGTITPDNQYNIFEPVTVTLTNVQEFQIINFTGKTRTTTLSGHIYIEEGDSIEFAYIEFNNSYMGAVTDSHGYYSYEIPYALPLYNYKIVPYKKGYNFTPDSMSLWNGITTDMTLDFIATPNEKISITGNINDNSRAGIENVLIIFSGKNGSCITDNNGFFSHQVRVDWSGTITPQKEGMVFDPPVIVLDNIDTNMTITTIGIDTVTNGIIEGKPVTVKVNKENKIEFEIVIYNPAGQLIGTAKNIETAQMLIKNAHGLYIYQRKVKNTITKTSSIILMK